MASTRRPRITRHTLGVGSLFPPETVFQDTDGDGYPDRLGFASPSTRDLRMPPCGPS